MGKNNYAAIVLAAGKGTRMQSELPKVLHEINGKPLLYYSLNTLALLNLGQVITVIKYKAELVEAAVRKFSSTDFVIQGEHYGTAAAASDALPKLGKAIEHIIILYADNAMFVDQTTYQALIEVHNNGNAVITMATMQVTNPLGKGRIIRNKVGNVQAIIEEKDANDEQRLINEVNPGLYIFQKQWFAANITKITPSSVTQEYYLTDLIELANQQGETVQAIDFGKTNQWFGVTTQDDLAAAEKSTKETQHGTK